ncbi:MAG: phosphatidylserine/phosphatidylglycerophosphate/cardiolipin synthase family protein, partial [Sphingomonadales bacterium]
TSVIVGGFNIEDDYFAGAGDNGWRDLGLLVEGPAVARLAPYFDALKAWVHAPGGKFRDLRATLKRASETSGPVRWLMGGPTRRLSPWAIAIKREMEQASQLSIIAGYFAPNPAILRRIERVAKRGGSSRVMTASLSDNDATIAAARHTYARLLRRGVRVFEYVATKLHTKLFVIDDAVHIGSANLDIRSLYINLELMLRVEDARFATLVRHYYDAELDDAREIVPTEHGRHGWFARLKWGAAYFLVAVLDLNVTRRLNFGLDGR